MSGRAREAVVEPDHGDGQTWTVGELAAELGVSTRTLRFYEAEGLVSPERRGTSRIYHARDHARMRLILRGRRFGMSLSEISELIGMYDGAESSERRQLARLLERMTDIEKDLRARMADLQRTLDEIAVVSDQCRGRLGQLKS
jgi:DNA-binding transcriptional MerR regulator